MFEDLRTIDIIFIILILIIAYKVFFVPDKLSIEGFDVDREAIENLASVLNTGDMTVSNLNVTSDLNVTGKTTLNDDLDAKKVPIMAIGALSVTGDTNLNGKLTVENSTHLKSGCKIEGSNPDDNNTTLTIIDPTGVASSHFYYRGDNTYLGGGNKIYIRTKQQRSGMGQRTLLEKGVIIPGIPNPFTAQRSPDRVIPLKSDFEWD